MVERIPILTGRRWAYICCWQSRMTGDPKYRQRAVDASGEEYVAAADEYYLTHPEEERSHDYCCGHKPLPEGQVEPQPMLYDPPVRRTAEVVRFLVSCRDQVASTQEVADALPCALVTAREALRLLYVKGRVDEIRPDWWHLE